MSMKRAFEAVAWATALLAAIILFFGNDKRYPWILLVLLIGLSLRLGLEAFSLLSAERSRRRLKGLEEFASHAKAGLPELRELAESSGEAGGILVETCGIAAGDGTLVAPLSRRPCLAYALDASLMAGFGGRAGTLKRLDAAWSPLELSDGGGRISVDGPGILDAAGFAERVFSLATLEADFPRIARAAADAFGPLGDRERKRVRFLVREYCLLSGERIRAFGRAALVDGGLRLSGTDVLDDPESLLLRSERSPAHERLERGGFRAAVFASLSLAALALALAWGKASILDPALAPGGRLDPERGYRVLVDLDGRALRLSLGSDVWYFEAGDARKGVELQVDGESRLAGRSETLGLQAFQASVRSLSAGDGGYPAWDGRDWVLDAGAAEAGPAAGKPATAGKLHGSGRIYVRNLSSKEVNLRVVPEEGRGKSDLTWTYHPREWADDATGSWLNDSDSGPIMADGSERIEFLMGDGSRRVLRLAEVAEFRPPSSWLLSVREESLAANGILFVRNPGREPVRIWILNGDGSSPYGAEPWLFEPGEGLDKNKGLSLLYQGQDVRMSGYESIKLASLGLRELSEGKLGQAAARKGGAWRLEVSAFRGE